MPQRPLARRHALALLSIVTLTWGLNWPVTKMIVQDIPPLWTTAVRSLIAGVVLGVLVWMKKEFVVPRRGDIPIVLSTALLHMTAYSALVAAGLQFLPAGRATVLGYTMPIWVMIGAPLLLSERISRRKALGVVAGLAGLGVIFSPGSLDWSDRQTLIGSGLVMLAALCWAAHIIYVRAHKWVSSPFQLVFWQVLLACVVLTPAAALYEGIPDIAWTPGLVGLLLFSGIAASGLAHWAMTVVNRNLPAMTTSLGLLATPALGIASGIALLGEPFEPSLLVALVLLVGGIAIGIVGDAQEERAARGSPQRRAD